MTRSVAKICALLTSAMLVCSCSSSAKLLTTALGPERNSIVMSRELVAQDATSTEELLAKRGSLGLTSARPTRYEGNGVQADGTYYAFTHGVSWIPLSPGVLTMASTNLRLFIVTRFDNGAVAPTWSASIATVKARPECNLGWLRTMAIFAVCYSDDATDLIMLNPIDGSWKPLLAIPYSAGIKIAETAQRLAAISTADPKCGGCLHVAVHSLVDGRLISNAEISPAGAKAFEISPQHTIGFDGRLLWSYTPESSDERYPTLRMWEEPRTYGYCYYDVFDLARGGARVRTLDDASGPWAAMTNKCKVRALFALPNGGVIALHETPDHKTEVVTFSAPP